LSGMMKMATSGKHRIQLMMFFNLSGTYNYIYKIKGKLNKTENK